MRPYVVEILNQQFGTTVFVYLVPNYTIMLSIAMIVSTIYAARRAKQTGLGAEHIYGLALWGLPAALLGARLLHALYASRAYSGGVLAFLDPLQGDSVGYGGYIAGVTVAILYLYHKRLEVWRYADVVAPAIGLGIFFGRLGCFLDGDDFGAISDSLLAVQFPAGSPASQSHFEMGLLPNAATPSLPVHPVQLYLAMNGLVLSAVAAAWSRRARITAPGEAFCLFWLFYACTRFLLEFFRGDVSRGFIGPLSTSQAISTPIAVVAAMVFWQRYKNRTSIISRLDAKFQ